MRNNPELQSIELALCKRDILHWFDWWPWTYDPRDVIEGSVLPAWRPFMLFPRQRELVQWTVDRIQNREDGAVPKSRGEGVTWLMVAVMWHYWRFVPGFKATFGSRVVELVDHIDDPDAIFTKLRWLYESLPPWMMPDGFNRNEHDKYKLLVNPKTQATIRGEGGDEMGRGGRSTVYIVDEASFVPRAQSVEAATTDNADCRLWVSTLNPSPGNFFIKKLRGGTLEPHQIFRLHYSTDPRRTKEWIAKKKKSTDPATWAAEYEIDDTVSAEDICIPIAHVQAAQRLKQVVKEKLGKEVLPSVDGVAGGDVGAGKAKSVCLARFGPIVTVPTAWTNPDTTDTAFKMLDYAAETQLVRSDSWVCRVKVLRYDPLGVGLGVTSTLKRNPRENLMVIGVGVGAKPSDTLWPDGQTSKLKFTNVKGELWWTMRERFKNTFEMVLFLEDHPEGIEHALEDCISLPADTEGPHAQQLATELSCVKYYRTETGKIIIESKESLAKRGIKSPDYADALALTHSGLSQAERWAAFQGLPGYG